MSYLPSNFNPDLTTNLDLLITAEEVLQKDLKRVQNRIARLTHLTEMQQLAVYMFDKDRNRDENWYYEIKDGVDDWNGLCHANYLRKARYLLEIVKVDLETAKQIVVNLK